MSEYDAWDFQDDDDDQPIDPRSLPKQLRKVIRDAKAEAKQAKEEAETLRKQNREILVGNVLRTKGVPEKVAKLIPGDVSSPEAIDTWLTEYGDVFGTPSASTAAPSGAQGQGGADNATTAGVNAEEIAAIQKMQNVASTGLPFGGKAEELLAKINDPNLTQEQFMDLLAKGGL